jgi:hypothetical protein
MLQSAPGRPWRARDTQARKHGVEIETLLDVALELLRGRERTEDLEVHRTRSPFESGRP